MKISTLLSEGENYAVQLNNDLNMYLTRLKANGIYTIATDMLSNELDRLGHSVTPEALVDMLADNKYIQNATIDSIDLKGAPTSNDLSADEAKMKVHNMAISASRKGI
jgi:hypothetical protein